MKIKPGQSFYSLPIISALFMALGVRATLGDACAILHRKR